MKVNYFHITFYILTTILLCPGCSSSDDSIEHLNQRPNIVIIMADDLGFSDLGCYGSKIETPNIDQLASEGLRFTQFYNASRCCPSRASLMTGLHPHQVEIGHMTVDRGYPGYTGDLGKSCTTIAELLRVADYQTLMCGKWHLTPHTQQDSPDHNWPNNRGFDRFYGTLPGHGSFWNPAGLMEDGKFITPDEDFYYTEALSEKAVQYINEADNTRPLFLYVAYTAPHYPLHAREKKINKYKGKFSMGWDSLRLIRHKNLISENIINENIRLSERDEQGIPWEEEENQEWQQNRMETYAAMIDHMDEGIGQIIESLKNRDLLDNTLVLFFSDNGGSAEGHLNGTIERLHKPWVSKVIPDTTQSGIKVVAGDFPGLLLGPDSTYGSYGARWSNVSNTPFRRHKSWMHEGGIASPLIAYWPAKISEEKGLRHHLTHITDILPTCLEIAEVEYPETSPFILEGKSMISAINNVKEEERTLYWEHEGNKAIRKGKWKLVSEFPGTWKSLRKYSNEGNWELYNMENDRTELNNLASDHPEMVNSLSKEWEQWAQTHMVLNWEDIYKLDW